MLENEFKGFGVNKRSSRGSFEEPAAQSADGDKDDFEKAAELNLWIQDITRNVDRYRKCYPNF